jgi:glycosyltransferase involved in cell wall biosynthesis
MSAIPDVSVVVPTYQRAALLGASLESLLAQEGVAFEVVVVDDGSTDGTAAFLETSSRSSHPGRHPAARRHRRGTERGRGGRARAARRLSRLGRHGAPGTPGGAGGVSRSASRRRRW